MNAFRLIGALALLVCSILVFSGQSMAQGLPCRSTDNGTALDFWLGRWRVVDPTTFAAYGTNNITRTLNGCAVEENWLATDGFKAKSLYYFNAPKARWEQVWVTEDTSRLGGLKNKIQMVDFSGAGIQFQGFISGPNGQRIVDRTTIRALGDGRIRQLIEQSSDGGTTWATIFDGLYIPLSSG